MKIEHRYQAEAMVRMTPARAEYNEGVLSMMGLAQLGADYRSAFAMAEIQAELRNELLPEGDDLLTWATAYLPADHPSQQALDFANKRRNDLWREIERYIDDARVYLGMGTLHQLRYDS